jgi:hypothetical protein
MSDGNVTTAAEVERIVSLKDAVERLKTTLKRVGRDLKATRERAEQAERDRDAANTKAVKAQQDFDANPLKARVDELNQKLRDTAHKATFARLARSKGVADDAIDLVYQHSGYRAEQDEPDEAAIGSLIDGLKDRPGVSRLFGEPGPNGNPGPAKGQGGRSGEGSKFRVTAAQLRDPNWCLQNQERRLQAIKDGTYEVVE